MSLSARLEVRFPATPQRHSECVSKPDRFIGKRSESKSVHGEVADGKAAAGSPVAVGSPHPEGSNPFPLRQFFVSA
jgi:hypothetical protein